MKYILPIGYFIILIFLSYNIIHLSNKKRQYRYELSELNSVRHGLFDVEQWKENIADIIVKKINEYEITADNREYIKGYIETGFYKLLDELSLFLGQEQTKGNWFEQIIKTVTYNIVFDKDSFKSQVPLWAEEIMTLIENPKNQSQLKSYLESKIIQLLKSETQYKDKTLLKKILSKYSYQQKQLDECKSFLKNSIKEINTSIIELSIVLLIISLLPYLLGLLEVKITNLIISKAISLFCLFIVGISISMISIDVRILKFNFLLLNENITFKNQVLYFQSKSVLEVLRVLIVSTQFKSLITGLFIFLFSVVFPIVKIISLLLESLTSFSNQVTDFFVNKSSKWSMADVMVVSIFLAYLGINSLLNDLLQITSTTANNLDIIPNNNHSNLEIGVIFYLFFVILSLFTKPEKDIKSKMIFGRTF